MKTVRIVSYAINGRGMGHLVRQLAILRWVRRILALLDVPCEAWVLTSSEADTLARREGVPALKMPSKAMVRDAGLEPARYLAIARPWVLNAIAGLQPDILIVDTFPGGSFGELVAALELAPRRVLVARAVRDNVAADDAYRALLPMYDLVLRPDDDGCGPILIRERDELLPRQEARRALGIPDDRRAVYVSLGGGGDLDASGLLPDMVTRLAGGGRHVVVGAGPLYSGREVRGPDITWLDRYVPSELLPGIDAAVSAAGYNSFHELMHAGIPTVFLPQPRLSDDQAARAARAEAAGAGCIARSIDEVAQLLESPGDPAAARALVPGGGAKAAALAVLAGVVPTDDLALADRAFTPELVRLVQGLPAAGREGSGNEEARWRQTFALLRLCGDAPRRGARRRALLAELAAQGAPLPDRLSAEMGEGPETATGRLQRITTLCEQVGAPLDTSIALLHALRRKFPLDDSDALIRAAERLWPVWARFDDWMGAVSLLRAVPRQRTLEVVDFAEGVERWLENEEDLFEALRAFARSEGDGQRPVGEVLGMLRGNRVVKATTAKERTR